MKRILLLFCIVFLCIDPLRIFSKSLQKPVTPVRPAPAVSKAMPYVLKKDFDPMIQAMDGKVRSALGAASSARREISGIVDTVTQLNTKMSRVEEILSSANFLLTLTSDSLKTTQNSVEEFRKQTETNFAAMQVKNSELTMYVYILLALCVLLPVIVLIVMLIMVGKLRSTLSKQTEYLNIDMKKLGSDLKGEMQSLKSSVQGEVYSLSTDIKVKMMHEKDDIDSQFSRVMQKLDTKQDKIVDEGE